MRLRAERSEMQSELYASQAQSLKDELATATRQLEETIKGSGLLGKEQEMLARITVRGRGVTQSLERQESEVQLNLAALAAELEALELTPRAAVERDDDSASDATPRDGKSTSAANTGSAEAEAQALQVLNALVVDNDLLKREYLDLARRFHAVNNGGAAVTPSETERVRVNELAIARAAQLRLEGAAPDVLCCGV